MASFTYEQLKEMTVVQLREIAQGLRKDHEELEGYATKHKEQLLPMLCKVLGVHTHHAAKGEAKTHLKMQIHRLRAKRDEMLKANKKDQLPTIHHQIHVLKHKLRRIAAAAK
jgi:protein-arginine kinase activator protein McsA